MPPLVEKSTENITVNEDDKKNLWSQILHDVQKNGNPKLSPHKQILVLGDNESGKTTMVAKLQGIENSSKGSGLEYAYIDVRDDYRDDHTRLSVWVLDGDPAHVDLLKFALNEETFQETLVILTVSMTTPWGILEQLQHWASVLADYLDKLKLDIDLRQARKQLMIKMWLDYVEPGDELDPASPMKRSSRNLGDDDELFDGNSLPEGTLTSNLGLDIVVVVTKTDFIQNLEKEQDYRDEHLDFMQQWIRKFCLQYGAALFYTSAKEDKNCDLLYKYLTHRIYGFPFHTPALVVEKDAVFIPAGWDNMKKICILYENMHSCTPENYYRDVIVQPVTRKAINRETEIIAEDEQAFLTRQQQISFGGGAPSIRLGESPARPPIGGIQGSPRKLDGSKVVSSPGGEGVLANFFNSLLYKKTGSPGGGASKISGAESLPDKSMRTDAAAELDRLARGAGKKLPVSTTPNAHKGTGTGSTETNPDLDETSKGDKKNSTGSSITHDAGVDFNASDC
ncbi:cytoplasmic dynein 1 light intermediate chain 2 [Diorhabda sublineata]|uniref:cytoplasmic dynein 1 light intermediate chain 2 n=1 Tax=Diorhabda sublineata TaxID=1163346 RepID=UPI0024E0F639|nr:cytoplasmic dynein 1 light intermediate chain 2 [Diorhabda sublineata]